MSVGDITETRLAEDRKGVNAVWEELDRLAARCQADVRGLDLAVLDLHPGVGHLDALVGGELDLGLDVHRDGELEVLPGDQVAPVEGGTAHGLYPVLLDGLGQFGEKIENIAILLKAAINAKSKVGLKMNVPEKSLKRIMSLLSSMHSPTISQLSDEGWYALEVIIEEKIVRDLIPKLKAVGAEGIIEYPLNKVIP